MWTACLSLGVLAIPAYLIAGGGSFGHALFAQVLLAIGTVTANVVTAVLLSELFPTRVRYTASAVTYNLAYAVFGGTAPFVSTWLIVTTGSRLSPAGYLAGAACVALPATSTIPETAGRSLSTAGFPSVERRGDTARSAPAAG